MSDVVDNLGLDEPTEAEAASAAEVITLGCRLNTYESEVMRGHAQAAGLNDAVIINTCAVTLSDSLYRFRPRRIYKTRQSQEYK